MGYININKKRASSGAFYRLFRDESIANLMSSTQACVISNGMGVSNKLIKSYNGKLPIFKGKEVNTTEKTLEVLKKNKTGCIIFGGFLYKKSGKKQEIDVIIYTKGKLFVCEIKDGNSLDTKKSTAEIDSIISAVEFLNKLGYSSCVGKLILMNLSSNGHSIKDDRASEFIMSGIKFCKKFLFDFNKFQDFQNNEAEQNKQIALNEFQTILELHGYSVQPPK